MSFYIFSIQSFQLFNLSIDNIIINYYISLSSVSLFSVATNIASLVGFGLSSINIFLAPSISSLFHNNKTKDLQSILNEKQISNEKRFLFCQKPKTILVYSYSIPVFSTI